MGASFLPISVGMVSCSLCDPGASDLASARCQKHQDFSPGGQSVCFGCWSDEERCNKMAKICFFINSISCTLSFFKYNNQ